MKDPEVHNSRPKPNWAPTTRNERLGAETSPTCRLGGGLQARCVIVVVVPINQSRRATIDGTETSYAAESKGLLLSSYVARCRNPVCSAGTSRRVGLQEANCRRPLADRQLQASPPKRLVIPAASLSSLEKPCDVEPPPAAGLRSAGELGASTRREIGRAMPAASVSSSATFWLDLQLMRPLRAAGTVDAVPRMWSGRRRCLRVGAAEMFHAMPVSGYQWLKVRGETEPP